jgi:hypothetical protein
MVSDCYQKVGIINITRSAALLHYTYIECLVVYYYEEFIMSFVSRVVYLCNIRESKI